MTQSSHELAPVELQPNEFDRSFALRAYEQQLPALHDRMATVYASSTPIPCTITDPDHLLVLSNDELERLWGLFPEAARNRALPARIEGDRPLWFSDTSTANLKVTRNLDDGLSPTTFVLGVNELTWDESDGIGVKVYLYQTPESVGFSREVLRVSQAKVAVHEFAHSILTPDATNRSVELALPSGRRIIAADYLSEMYEAAMRYPAISDYAAAYRREGFTEDRNLRKQALHEELPETIAGYLLGFTVSAWRDGNPPELTFRPFEGRGDVERLVHDYLHAERVGIRT